jgi:hypothetical protein
VKQKPSTLKEKREQYYPEIKKGNNLILTRRSPLSMWLSFSAVAVGLGFAIAIYLQVIPLGYELGPYRLNHWAAWLSLGFIINYVPLFIILKRRNHRLYKKLMKVHQIGFISAFVVVSLHIGWQMRRVFPPELGTGIALYLCLFVLVVTGIMQRYQMLVKQARTLRFVHLSMVVSFFLIMVFHIIRALIFIGQIRV